MANRQDHIPIDLGHATLRLGISASLGTDIYLRFRQCTGHQCVQSLFVNPQRLSREILGIAGLFLLLVFDILLALDWAHRHFHYSRQGYGDWKTSMASRCL